MTELTIDQALQQGIAAHRAGKLQEAERLYRAIIGVRPQHPDANHNLGVVAVAVGKVDSALPLFKTALDANPGTEQFWFSYIDALIKEKQFELADSLLSQGKSRKLDYGKLDALDEQLTIARQSDKVDLPSRPPSLGAPPETELKELLSYYQQGNYEDAEKLALSITTRFPNHQFSWGVLGALYLESGRVSKAVYANEKVVKLNPQDPTAHYNVGVCLQNFGRLEDAENSYKNALSLNARYAEAHSNLGVIRQKMGKFDEAEQSYKQVIRLAPGKPQAYSNLGGILQMSGRFKAARKRLRQATILNSHFPLAHYNLGLALQNLGELEEASKSYRQAIRFQPDYPEAHYNLGNILQELERFDEAVASYQIAIECNPVYEEAHYNLGNSLRSLGDLEAALRSYKTAITIKTDYAQAYGNLGATQTDLDVLVEGIKNSKKAIVLEPRQPLSYFNLGTSRSKVGDLDLSIKSFERANTLEPEFKNNKLLLKILSARRSRKGGELHPIARETPSLTSKPFITHLEVPQHLISTLTEMKSRGLDTTPDTRFGNGRCSPDYDFFEDDTAIIRIIAVDLINIMEDAVGSEVFVYDSFFNIYGSGAGITRHTHLNNLDREEAYGLANQKYSLVYYLSVGDQNCSEPGFLRFHEPDEEILPDAGMVIIFPASRAHSAVYGGEKDRVMIGANFYSI